VDPDIINSNLLHCYKLPYQAPKRRLMIDMVGLPCYKCPRDGACDTFNMREGLLDERNNLIGNRGTAGVLEANRVRPRRQALGETEVRHRSIVSNNIESPVAKPRRGQPYGELRNPASQFDR